MSPRAVTVVAFEAAGCVLDDGIAFHMDDAVERLRLAWERAGRPAARLAIEAGPRGVERLIVEPRAAPCAASGASEAIAEPSKSTSAEPFSPW